MIYILKTKSSGRYIHCIVYTDIYINWICRCINPFNENGGLTDLEKSALKGES